MAGPTLVDYLEIRERELESQISHVRGALLPLETELTHVRKMRALLADAGVAGLTDLASNASLGEVPKQMDIESEASVSGRVPSELLINGKVVRFTIKDMILRALTDHFHNGATPTELRDYIKAAFDREFDRNSISPQLARLRDEGVVDMLEGGRWRLSKHGVGIMRYGYVGALRKFIQEGEATELSEPQTPKTRLGKIGNKPGDFLD